MMKKLTFLTAMLLVICFSCSDDKSEITGEESKGKGILLINSVETTGTKSSPGTSYEWGDLQTAILTIEQNGEVLEGYDAKEIQLEKWGETSTLNGIELKVGDAYSITEFELKNKDKITTFASPTTGSEAASWVQKSLPIKFSIAADKTTEIEIQVVTTLGANPEDFGYNQFTFADKTPKVQAYLKNIETIFLDKGDKMIHHFTKRGIPTYSEVYRNHVINEHIILDYISETIKHYYIDDETLPEKLTLENHQGSDVREYRFKNFHASGNIAEIESSDRNLEIDDKGLITKYTLLNEAGVSSIGWNEYLYNENGYLVEKKVFDVEGEYKYSYNYTVDNEGNQLSATKVKDNGNIVYPKFSWTYADGKKAGMKTISLDKDNKEYLSREEKYEYNGSGLLIKKVETQNLTTTIIITTEFIYDGKQLIKSTTTRSDDTNYLEDNYYNELGYLKDSKSSKNVYDFRGRLAERHYQEKNYNIIEIYNVEAKLMQKRYYNQTGILIQTIFPNKDILMKYWPNGKQKFYIEYNIYANILANEELTETEINYKRPKTSVEFNLLNYIKYTSGFNEEGIRQYWTSVKNKPTDDGRYSNGRIIEIEEYQYRKQGSESIVIKETVCKFYYKYGSPSYCDPSQLYIYSVAELNVETGESSFKTYDSDGTER